MPKDDTQIRPSDPILRIVMGAWTWAMARMVGYLVSLRFWCILAITIVTVAISGPFQSIQEASFGQALIYWSILLVPVILGIFVLSLWLREIARRMDVAWGWPSLVAGLFGGIWVIACNAVARHAVFGHPLWEQDSMLNAMIVGITVIITLAVNSMMPVPQRFWGMKPRTIVPSDGLEPEGDGGPLFSRLPASLGTEIMWVRADNHHLEVRTTLGEARVLIRLSDAERELAVLPGQRVHRSWWANMDHVTDFGALDGKTLQLLMLDGARIPVSRARAASVAAALPAAQKTSYNSMS